MEPAHRLKIIGAGQFIFNRLTQAIER